jgi:hypothetical protein
MIPIKKIVHYIPTEIEIKVGSSAIVLPVDHYNYPTVSNEEIAITSWVVAYDKETGIFETENSIYHPQKS